MAALRGEEIHGKFSLFTSKENRRNLEFEIRSNLETEVVRQMCIANQPFH